MKRFRYLLIVITLLGTFACKENFNPPEVDTNLGYLTVEGLINTGGIDSTIIRVSRTVKLTNKVSIKPELKAVLTIESDDNTVKRNLTERSPGVYYSLPFTLDATKLYRLRIITLAGKEYVSDLTEAKVSPPIDALGFDAQTTGQAGVQVYANTHDVTNRSRYYKWDFEETYEIKSQNISQWIFDNRVFRVRNLLKEDLHTCWKSANSTNIVLASSAKLTNDVLYKTPIQRIPPNNEKLGVRYSILVKQQVLTKEAFEFWEILKKNTEQVGSIFDAQPSQLKGNIHSVSNRDEIVIGYISAGTVQRKRLFIDATEIPREFMYTKPPACPVDTIKRAQFPEVFYSGDRLPVDAFFPPPPEPPYPTAITTTTRECIDCTFRGTNIKPPFWQY